MRPWSSPIEDTSIAQACAPRSTNPASAACRVMASGVVLGESASASTKPLPRVPTTAHLWSLSPSPCPTAGFAQPAGCGGAEQCSAKPRLRPMERDDGGSSLGDSILKAVSALGRPCGRDGSASIAWAIHCEMEVLPLVPVIPATQSFSEGRPYTICAISPESAARPSTATIAVSPAPTFAATPPPASTSTAAAPRATACAMKSRPSTCAPGNATNMSPGRTRRESAVRRVGVTPFALSCSRVVMAALTFLPVPARRPSSAAAPAARRAQCPACAGCRP